MRGESELERIKRYIRQQEVRIAHHKDVVGKLGCHHPANGQARRVLQEAQTALDAFHQELLRLRAREESPRPRSP